MIAVGKKMPEWIVTGYQTYISRLPREYHFELIEIEAGKRTNTSDLARIQLKESQQILAKIQPSDWVIALEVTGNAWTTESLSKKLIQWQMDGHSIVLLIGGPEGLSQACLQRANQYWSLSNLTLPHPLVRVVVAEALYRAWTLTVNHPYHRD